MVSLNRLTRKKLGELLVEQGLLSDAQVQDALRMQHQSGLLFGETLVQQNLITEDKMVSVLVSQFGIPFIQPSTYNIPKELLEIFEPTMMRRFQFVPMDSIEWIESANNYVQLHCGPRRHLLNESLTNLAGRLNPAKFLRIHRGRIVNLSRIETIHPLIGGSYELELRSGIRLTSGRQYKDQIQALLRS